MLMGDMRVFGDHKVKYSIGDGVKVFSKLFEWSALVFICLVISTVVSWHFFQWHGGFMEDLYRYQRDLLSGHPAWIATQNRVLGPYLIDLLMHWREKDYTFSYNHFMHLSFFLISISLLVLCKAYRLDNVLTIIILITVSGVELLMFNHWWFPWSNLEFMLFCFAFSAMRIDNILIRIIIVGLLFIMMALNKETAVFFPFFLAIREISHQYLFHKGSVTEIVKKVTLFALMILASLKLTSFIRRELWVSGSEPGYESGIIKDVPQFLGNNIEIVGHHAWDRTVSVLHGLHAMIMLKNPVPLFGNKYWGDWSQSQLFFWTCFFGAFFCAIRTFIKKDAENFSIAMTCFAYAFIILALSNPVELDKMMGFLAFCTLYLVKRFSAQNAAVVK
jgi:hypothetical protein